MNGVENKPEIPDISKNDFPETHTNDGRVLRTIGNIKTFLSQYEDFKDIKADEKIRKKMEQIKNDIDENIKFLWKEKTDLLEEDIKKIEEFCQEKLKY